MFWLPASPISSVSKLETSPDASASARSLSSKASRVELFPHAPVSGEDSFIARSRHERVGGDGSIGVSAAWTTGECERTNTNPTASNRLTPLLGITVILEPAYRLFKRDRYRRLGQSEFSNGFRAIIVHHVFGHLDAFERNARRSVGDIVGHPLIGIGERQDGYTREFEFRRGNTRQAAQNRKDLVESEILIAENVPLADPSFLHGQSMPHRDIVHVHEIHAGFNICRHPPLHEIHTDLSRRRWLGVSVADGSARIDDNHRQSRAGEVEHFLLRQKFGSLVVPDHLLQRDWRPFVARPTSRRQTDGADRARVHDVFDTDDSRGCS